MRSIAHYCRQCGVWDLKFGNTALWRFLDGGRVEIWRDRDISDETFEHMARGMRSTKARAFKSKVDDYEYASISTG